MARQARNTIRLGTTKGAKRLRKRLGKLVPSEPRIGGHRNKGLVLHLWEFALSAKQLKGKRVLFVGSGCGKVIEEARKEGIKAFGVEPDPRDDLNLKTIKAKRFVTRNIIQNFVPKKPYDYVIAYWSVPLWLEKAYDKRLSFFRMLSSLKVGGEMCIMPMVFHKQVGLEKARVAPSIKRKILKAGFKIIAEPNPKMGTDILIVERTPYSDLRKLQELLSL